MLRKLIALLHRRGHDREKGIAAIEFALMTPILVVLVLGAADYGTLMNTSASLRGATRAGAEYAKANWNNPSVTNVTTATEQTVCGFLGLTYSSSSASCSPVTPPVTPGVSTSCTCDDDTSVTPCPPTGANPCASQTNPGVLQYVTVTAQQNFNAILSWTSVVFPTQVSATTTVRTQ
jgi:Flp pilus assembly protein TadG